MQTSPRNFFFFISVFCGLLLTGISILLVTGSFDLSGLYPANVNETIKSKEMWGRVSYYGGWALMVASLVLIIANALLFFFGKKLSNHKFTLFFAAIFLGCILTATIITATYINRL